jgi:hypothetical protein
MVFWVQMLTFPFAGRRVWTGKCGQTIAQSAGGRLAVRDGRHVVGDQPPNPQLFGECREWYSQILPDWEDSRNCWQRLELLMAKKKFGEKTTTVPTGPYSLQ